MPPAKPWDSKADAAHDYQPSRHDPGQAPRDLTPPSRTDLTVTSSWDLLGIDETSFTRSPKLTVLLGLLDKTAAPALPAVGCRSSRLAGRVGEGVVLVRHDPPVIGLAEPDREPQPLVRVAVEVRWRAAA